MIIMAVVISTENAALSLCEFKVLDFMNYRPCHGLCS